MYLMTTNGKRTLYTSKIPYSDLRGMTLVCGTAFPMGTEALIP